MIGTPDDIYVTGEGEVAKGAVDLASLGLSMADLVPSSGSKGEFAFIPASIVAVADRESAPADGKTAVTITAEVRGRDGKLAPDGTEVAFSTTLGTLGSSTALTSGGTAATTLVSAQPGRATVTASAGQASSSVEVEFLEAMFPARYLIFEVYDHYASNGATITEIEVYDRQGSKIAYIPREAYDSVTKANPAYWEAGGWNKGNLNDGDIYYVGNYPTGYNSSTIFLWRNERESCPNTGQWARFALDLGAERGVGLVRIAAGSPEGRIPHYIEVYAGAAYSYEANLKGRSNERLTFVGRIEPQPTQTSVRWFEIHLP